MTDAIDDMRSLRNIWPVLALIGTLGAILIGAMLGKGGARASRPAGSGVGRFGRRDSVRLAAESAIGRLAVQLPVL